MQPFAAHADAAAPGIDEFAGDVEYYLGLSPRQLPSRYFYDALGSALFDAICCLPWYRITRAEQALLAAHGAELFAQLDRLTTIVELGPGSGEKLATLLGTRKGALPLALHLVDVSAAALVRATQTLAPFDAIRVNAHQATYESGLQRAAGDRRSGRRLTLFLGSNIGNFDPPGADAFLRTIRAALAPGDALLLGTDLVKPEHELVAAYDDPLGVTAAFNRNLLVRINRELGGDFDIAQFSHRAVWNGGESRVEMHLVSMRRQSVRVPKASLEIDFEAGETIWTESSYKYVPDAVTAMLGRACFRQERQWIDPAGFALTLAQAE